MFTPFAFMSSPAGGEEIITDGLFLYWDASVSASVATPADSWDDLTANPNDIPWINVPTYATDEVGGYFEFNGVDSYGKLLDNASLDDNAGGFTMAFWLKADGTATNDWVMSKMAPSFNNGYGMFINGSGYPQPHFRIGATTYSPVLGTTTMLGSWLNVVITYNNLAIKAYINDVEVGSFSVSGSITPGPSFINLGTTIDASTQYYKGKMAQMLLYNRALSSIEITDNYNVDKARFGY